MIGPIERAANLMAAKGIPLDFISSDGFALAATLKPEATPQQQAQADAICAETGVSNWRPRPLRDIIAAVNALSGANKTAVWNDLSGGTPPKYKTVEEDAGYGIAPVDLVHGMIQPGGLLAGVGTAQQRTDATTLCRVEIAAMYVRERPFYLRTPSFASGVDIPGDEAVP